MSRRKTLLQARQGSVVSDNNEDGNESVGFSRTLTAVDLILYGVGSSIGAGIYVLVGLGAEIAGPSISLSFFICGMACILTSLAYAEFASRIPVAGSAFTYTYVAFGEFFAWLIGWNLILGYGFTTSVVARAWADYTGDFLIKICHSYGIHNTAWLERLTEWYVFGNADDEASYSFSLLSILIVVINTWILLRGVKDSARFNNAMTVLNVTVLALVVLSGISTKSINVDNLQPFATNGVSGVLQGAGLVFFAFIGFDMVASLSEEVINPEVNMPIGIVGSLVASTAIYVAVSFVVVGMAPLHFLKSEVPVVNALLINACCTHDQQLQANAQDICLQKGCVEPYLKPILVIMSRIVAFGAMLGLMASSFASFMGQPRIFYRMAMDGLWFRRFGEICPITQVPRAGIIITGFGTAFLACFVPLDALANLISLGTLMVFTFVDAGVILLRVRAIASAAPRSNPTLRKKRKAMTQNMIVMLLVYTISLLVASTLLANTNTLWPVLVFVTLALVTAGIITFLPDTWSQPTSSSTTTAGDIATASTANQQAGSSNTNNNMQSPDTSANTFICPFVPAIPLFGVACNAFMMGSLPLLSWVFIVIWLSMGVGVYFAYGIKNSELGKLLKEGELAPLLVPSLGQPEHHYHQVGHDPNIDVGYQTLNTTSVMPPSPAPTKT